MKHLIFISLASTICSTAYADRITETTDEYNQRQEAEQYEQYKEHNYNEPLGGYKERLGEPYQQNNQYQPQQRQNNYNQDWKERLKR